jgi:alkylation response protein AidB-like acyl-CoA dehydrogenase
VLAGTRGTCARMALGHATAGYEAAMRYVMARRQFGKPLASPDRAGATGSHHMVRHWADVESIHTFEGTETMRTVIVGRGGTEIAAFT